MAFSQNFWSPVQPSRVRAWSPAGPVMSKPHTGWTDGRTFGEVADFGKWRQAHVLLGGEAVAVKRRRPGVTLAGQHRGAAVPHCHTQTAAWLDEAVGWQRQRESE